MYRLEIASVPLAIHVRPVGNPNADLQNHLNSQRLLSQFFFTLRVVIFSRSHYTAKLVGKTQVSGLKPSLSSGTHILLNTATSSLVSPSFIYPLLTQSNSDNKLFALHRYHNKLHHKSMINQATLPMRNHSI